MARLIKFVRIRLLIALLLVFGQRANASEALQVALSIPAAEGQNGSLTGDNGLALFYGPSTKTIHFYVLITNGSPTIQRLWIDGMAWGYDNLSFELTDEEGHKMTATRPLTGFTVNVPAWWVLAPGETHVFEIYFVDPESWTGFPSLAAGERRAYSLRAVYKVNKSPESERHGIWTGDLASDPVRVIFHNSN